jgi:RNA polymerase sigma factor (sigma-70 family)
MRCNYESAIATVPNIAATFTPGILFVEKNLTPAQTLPEIPDAENQIDPRLILKNLPPCQRQEEESTMAAEDLMKTAVNAGFQGFVARRKGYEEEAETHFRDAMRFALQARQQASHSRRQDSYHHILFAGICFALNCGEVTEARNLIREASSAGVSLGSSEAWKQLGDVSLWKDAWLIAAVRRPEPDEQALNVLGERYSGVLAGRCEFLTTNHDRAKDLANDTWCRVLRSRNRLKPGGNFPAYLAMIATNLWRDAYRLSCRSGSLAQNQLYSLDLRLQDENGGYGEPLVDRIPDQKGLSPAEQTLLVLDVEKGLDNLAPQLRDVLRARFIQGESSAEIARRYGCTEQTISGRIRRGLSDMRRYFEDVHSA